MNLFNPHESFFELKIVKYTIFIILFLSGMIYLTIITNSNIKLNLTYLGFNTFFEIFKFPLGILALLIPVLAVYAANHRSEQAKETMRLTREQNNFANYYKHVEEFEKYVKKIKPEGFDRLDVDIKLLHSICFIEAKKGDYRLSNELIEKFKFFVSDYVRLFDDFMLKRDSTKNLSELKILLQTTDKFYLYFGSSIKFTRVYPENHLIDENNELDLQSFTDEFFEIIQLFGKIFSFSNEDADIQSQVRLILKVYSKIPTTRKCGENEKFSLKANFDELDVNLHKNDTSKYL